MLSMRQGSTPQPFVFDTGATNTIAPPETMLPTADEAAATTMPVSVALQNLCLGQPIAVAVCFLDASTNTWISRGWWTVAPGATQPNVVQAVGPVIFFYAEASSGMRWEGRDGDAVKPFSAPIDKINPFNVPADGSADKTMPYVWFAGGMMPAGQPVYVHQFTCN